MNEPDSAGYHATRDAQHQPVWGKWQRAGASFDLFFGASDVLRENPNVFDTTFGADDALWREHIREKRSLLQLAHNL